MIGLLYPFGILPAELGAKARCLDFGRLSFLKDFEYPRPFSLAKESSPTACKILEQRQNGYLHGWVPLGAIDRSPSFIRSYETNTLISEKYHSIGTLLRARGLALLLRSTQLPTCCFPFPRMACTRCAFWISR